MADWQNTLEAVRKLLASKPRIDLAYQSIRLMFPEGDLVVDGDVVDSAANERALERAAAIAEVCGVVDVRAVDGPPRHAGCLRRAEGGPSRRRSVPAQGRAGRE